MNRDSRMCETIKEDVIFVLSECQKERKMWRWKNIQRNDSWKLSKFGKGKKTHTDSRSWVNLEQDKPKEILTQT